MNKDPIHKQTVKTADVFVSDKNFDLEEALKAAGDKKLFLMKGLFGDSRYTNTFQNDAEYFQLLYS